MKKLFAAVALVVVAACQTVEGAPIIDDDEKDAGRESGSDAADSADSADAG